MPNLAEEYFDKLVISNKEIFDLKQVVEDLTTKLTTKDRRLEDLIVTSATLRKERATLAARCAQLEDEKARLADRQHGRKSQWNSKGMVRSTIEVSPEPFVKYESVRTTQTVTAEHSSTKKRPLDTIVSEGESSDDPLSAERPNGGTHSRVNEQARRPERKCKTSRSIEGKAFADEADDTKKKRGVQHQVASASSVGQGRKRARRTLKLV